nr:TIGR00366 family protein [Bacillus sp. HMF5848]
MNPEVETVKKKPMFPIPHTYAIIMLIIIIATVATYIVPAGEFERTTMESTGRTVVVEGSYAAVEQSPVGFFEMFKAIPTGMKDGASIIFFILLVGGAFGIIRATGAIEAGIGKAVIGLEGKERLMIPISMALFSVGGFSMGMAEESIIFVPIGVALARALGFDAITGTAMISLGAASGFIGGMLNPFTVGVAQTIAEVPLFSGIVFRSIVYVCILAFGIFFVMRYAYKVKKDPTKGVMYDIEQKAKHEDVSAALEEIPKLNAKHILVFVFLFGGLLFNMYGVFQWGWYITELTTSFIIIGLVCGFVGGLNVNKTFDAFVDGAKMLTFGALIVGFARGILVVMEEGRIIDTLINSLAGSIQNLPDSLTVLGMFITQTFLNFFIPSGSGQAATTMPIMTPLADILGLSRQVAVLAYQYGDGISNSIIPTSAALMGYLAVAGVPYDRWFKFIWKLILGWTVIAGVALVVAVMIGVQ